MGGNLHLTRYPMIATVPAEGELRRFGLRTIVSTTNFVYARLIGKHGQFPVHRKKYFDSTPRVRWWLERIKRVVARQPNVRCVYVFFDNDFSGHAPAPARRFADLLGLPRTFEAVSVQPDHLSPHLFM